MPEPHEQLDAEAIARALTGWFEANARDLPWRRTRDPYAIWVSEVMLQQTRVETVEGYWGRFLARFPDLASLAAADEQEVLGQWSGLGYYRRARLLHRGARHVRDELGGELPDRPERLREIPGIGRYTAGAIASIAFDRPAALVDGNVARVHARLAAIEEPREQDANHPGPWRFVERVLEHGSPRVLAQALMELGATVCTPRSPTCLTCPLRAHCRARAAGLEQAIPAVKIKRPSPELHFHAIALRWGDRLLLERRADEGLLAGLWCLPLFEGESDDRDALAEQARASFGVALELADDPVDEVRHVFSHRIWRIRPWIARAKRAPKLRGRDDGRELAWLVGERGPEGGIPTLTRKLLAALEREPTDEDGG
ncbi:A/G-specific adenine glycosylase [Nannocystaceae bacterium ST9]